MGLREIWDYEIWGKHKLGQKELDERVMRAWAPFPQHVLAVAEGARERVVLRQREREQLRRRNGAARPLSLDVSEELGALLGQHRVHQVVRRRPVLEPQEAAPEARLPLGPQVELSVRCTRLVQGRADDVQGDLSKARPARSCEEQKQTCPAWGPLLAWGSSPAWHTKSGKNMMNMRMALIMFTSTPSCSKKPCPRRGSNG